MATRYRFLISKWAVVPAVVALAVVAALLATALPVWGQERPPTIRDATTAFYYDENGTAPVTSYRARDPEGKPIFWTLGGPDASSFKIENGVLRFKSPPDFELGKGSAGDDMEIYKVTVRFGAGGEDGMPGADEYDGDDLEDIEVTVTVQNVNEPGMVVISPMQPQVGTDLTAILSDQDGVAVPGTWQWASSDSMNGPFTNIPRLSNRMSYAPTPADLGKYLRVEVSYVDRADPNPKSLTGLAGMVAPDSKPRPVRKDIVTTTDPPKFPSQRPLGLPVTDDTGDPRVRDKTERFIHENSPAGSKVGAPVTAFDDSTSIDPLTYSLRNRTATSSDAANFRIHPATGQITVAPGAKLAFSEETAATDDDDTYEVTVQAVDPDGHRRDIQVDIKVLDVNEGPTIERNYKADPDGTPGEADTKSHGVGDRAPTEISHMEIDRRSSEHSAVRNTLGANTLERDATILDADLDTPGILAAVYRATDPEDETGNAPQTNSSLKWTLKGPDAELLRINQHGDDKRLATLAFRPEKVKGKPDFVPDFEKPADANRNNVYEVTIVVTDVTSGKMDELDVTVKVINSTEDNEPGTVKILNRQPEVARALTAELEDPDGGVAGAQWQWYRYTQPTIFGTRCGDYNPFDDDATDTFRNFVADPLIVRNDDGNVIRRIIPDVITVTQADVDEDTRGWVVIDGATQRTYTPHFDDRAGGSATPETNATTGVVTEMWTGGDIAVTVTKTPKEGGGYTVTYGSWGSPRCLRAAVIYRDGAKDRTHRGDDDPDTTVNETREGAFVGSEYSVKQIDEENDRPVFTHNGNAENAETEPGNKVSSYRVDIPENATAAGVGEAPVNADFLLNNNTDPKDKVYAATDPMLGEDDNTGAVPPGPGADVLTYSLSGPDAKHFVIVGSIEHPESYDPDGSSGAVTPTDDEGSLFIKASLDYDGPNPKREYRVTITATDPSGDDASVNVIVTVRNVNEAPEWKMPDEDDHTVRYQENGTGPVLTFKAADPEGAGIGYSLLTAEPTGDPIGSSDTIAATQVVDDEFFTIDPISGVLKFKPRPDGRARPNYEKPEDAGANNEYMVAVQAKAVNPTNVEAPITTIYRAITVIVTNVNEQPVFSRDTDTLQIKENPDDPEKEPPLAEGYLYLLNRGVGIPGTTPAADDVDVGTPVAAADDDSTGNFAFGGYGDTVRDRIDGLTYELSGDTGPFHIVPATGQILTREKLDYEAKKTYKVTVKATDPLGASDTIPLTIDVTDVDETPVGGLLTITGDASREFEENSRDDLGIYSVSGARTTPTWTLAGPDGSHFMLEDTGSDRNRTLKFQTPPDYEMPRGQEMSVSNTNTYMVTVKASAGDDVKMVEVEVMVTDAEEPGTVKLSSTSGKVGTPITAELSEGDIVTPPIEWQWHRVDSATGTSNPITGARAASYTPVAADVGKLLKAMATYTDSHGSGKTAEKSITTPIADVNAAPAFAAEMDTREIAENTAAGVDIGAPVTATDANEDTLTYSLSGADAASFDIGEDTGQLMTKAMLDYEMKASYMVTITATDPDSATGAIAVTVNVTNVNEDGMVSLSPAMPRVGSQIMASVTDPDGSVSGESWLWSYSTAMAGPFTAYPAETAASFTPRPADLNRYLRVTASYTDVHGAQTAMATTGMVIRNADPAFAAETDTREIAENTAAGVDIGAPVTATDANEDALKYALGGTDMDSFGIDEDSGQLMTKAMLDYETKMSYMVTVTATDSYEASDSVMVTIMVTGVNEAPAFSPNTATRSVAENTAADMAIGDAIPAATDPDAGDTLTYALGGTDAASFDFDASTRQIKTKAMLDYETKTSYMVAVTATDGDGLTGSIDVTVMVTNVDETGMVVLSSMAPMADQPLTATLTDPDGGVSGVTWRWSKSMTMDGTFEDIADATSMSYTPMAADVDHYLMAKAMYTDGEGMGKSAMATTSGKVTAAAVVDPNAALIARYDTNPANGRIERSELDMAIRDHIGNTLSRGDLDTLIRLHITGS